MARDTARFARLLRTWWTRGQITHAAREPQPPDLRKRATPGGALEQGCSPGLADLLANPSIVGTKRRRPATMQTPVQTCRSERCDSGAPHAVCRRPATCGRAHQTGGCTRQSQPPDLHICAVCGKRPGQSGGRCRRVRRLRHRRHPRPLTCDDASNCTNAQVRALRVSCAVCRLPPPRYMQTRPPNRCPPARVTAP